MRNRIFALAAFSVVAAGVVCAQSPAVERCASEVEAMHGVWVSPQSYLPVYGDWELIAYLASVRGAGAGNPVLPVFSPEPLSFRSANVFFVSTGLILMAANAKELADAIERAPLTVLSRKLPACGAVAAEPPSGLAIVQQRLAEQLAGYQDATTRRLRRRGPEERP